MVLFSGLNYEGEAVIFDYMIGTIDPEINPVQAY